MAASRVLIVDDNEEIHEDFRQILKVPESLRLDKVQTMEDFLFDEVLDREEAYIPEYRIESAFQGQEAVEMVKKAVEEGDPYSVVFLDVRMPPGIDGIETAKRIWTVNEHQEICICTAYSDHSWEDIFKVFGSSEHLLFIKKPFNTVMMKQIAVTMSKKWELGRQVRAYIDNLEQKVRERTAEINGLLEQKNEYIQMIQSDLDLARSVQQYLLPRNLSGISGLGVHAHYTPCEKIGGDLYDIIHLGEKKYAAWISDVMGHGIAAALVTAIAKFTFRKYMRKNQALQDAVASLNLDLCKFTPDEMFLSAVILVMDLESMKAEICIAGHPPPVIMPGSGKSPVQFSKHSTLLGFRQDFTCNTIQLDLHPGDRILLFTDGITELKNPMGVMFGRDRLEQAATATRQADPAEVLPAILKEVKSYGSGMVIEDDVTMLMLVVN